MARIETGVQPAAVIEHGAEMRYIEARLVGKRIPRVMASVEHRAQMHTAGTLEIVSADSYA